MQSFHTLHIYPSDALARASATGALRTGADVAASSASGTLLASR